MSKLVGKVFVRKPCLDTKLSKFSLSIVSNNKIKKKKQKILWHDNI